MEVELSSDKETGSNEPVRYARSINKLPEHVRNLMESLSEIRRTVLETSPSLLTQIAPSLIAAEAQIVLLIDQ